MNTKGQFIACLVEHGVVQTVRRDLYLSSLQGTRAQESIHLNFSGSIPDEMHEIPNELSVISKF